MEFLQKVLNLFKSKKFLKIFTVSLSCLLIGIYALATLLSSYIPWKKYYDNAIAQKEHEKYLNSLPFEFLGISMELADGVNFYTDGRAEPTTKDFEVTAHFTEKGKNTDTILGNNEFTITAPEDFASNGGTVIASYEYQPEDTKNDDGETVTPDPITKTASLDISLTEVALAKLELTQNPYRVHYSDAMAFDAEGIKLNATYNNGDVISLDASDITVKTTGNLTSGTNAVKVGYELGGVSLECDVPVTVQSASSYNEGRVIKIETEGEIAVDNGADTSSAEPVVRATYDTGNKLILSNDKYTVKGNVKNASYEKNCILTITYNNDESVFCKAAASVVSEFESEDGTAITVNGGTKRNVTDESGKQVSVKEGFSAGNTIGFKISASAINKGQLALRLANTSSSPIKLASVMTLTVNDKNIPIDATLMLAPSSNTNNYSFETLTIATPLLKAIDNEVLLTFSASAKVAFDLAQYSTKYEGVFYSSMDEYVTQCLSEGITPQLTVSMSSDWQEAFVSGKPYLHGMCSDGENYYVAHTSYSDDTRSVKITKHDVATGKIIATSSETERKSSEAYASCAYIAGKVVTFFADGTCVCINPDLQGEWTVFDGFNFTDTREEGAIDFTNKPIKDVFYNNTLKKYSVLIGNQVFIFNDDMELETTISPKLDAKVRMSGSTDYIYVSTSHDGAYQPNIQIYDWSGTKAGTAVIPNTQEVMNEGVITAGSSIDLSHVNSQGIVTMNDSWYISFACWQQSAAGVGDRGCVIKVDYPSIPEKLAMQFSVGEYYEIANDQGVTLSATPSELQTIDSKDGYWSMDAVSDGKYVYYASNTGGNSATIIYKYNPLTDEVVAKSAQLSHGASGDNSKTFIKDGKICYIAAGKVYGCQLSTFDKGCEFKETNAFSEINNIVNANGEKVSPFAVGWNDAAGRYAVVGSNKLYIIKEDGTKIAGDIAVQDARSVSCDDKYIYIVRSYNMWDNNPIEIFTWDGTNVGTLNVSGYNSLKYPTNTSETLKEQGDWYNIQGVYTYKGNLYCVVAGAHIGVNIVDVNIDLSGISGI